jgi:hypothetical protein
LEDPSLNDDYVIGQAMNIHPNSVINNVLQLFKGLFVPLLFALAYNLSPEAFCRSMGML